MKKKIGLLKNVLKDYCAQFHPQNIKNISKWISGSHNLRYLNATIFLFISLFGYLEKAAKGESTYLLVTYCGIFLLLSICNIIIKNNYVVIISDITLGILIILLVTPGNLTGVLFVVFTLYRIENKYQYYVISFVFVSIIILSSAHNNLSEIQIILTIAGYLLFIGKYILTIHIPSQKLIMKNNELEKLVSLQIKEIKTLKMTIHNSPKLLTYDQILQRYPFMYFKETNPDRTHNPYRKIKDLILLASDKGYKEIAIMNKISGQTQHREFAKMKEEFAVVLNLDKKIDTLWGLVIAGIELGIITVKYRHSDTNTNNL